jgi:hypothetical protein
VRFYVYVSDTKVDMLTAQIRERRIRKIMQGLGVNVKIPVVPVEATYSGAPQPTDETRIGRLQNIEEAIAPADIGDVESDCPWIQGCMLLNWGFIDERQQAVCFVQCTAERIFVMGGSAKHLIGGVDVAEQPHHAYSVLPVLLRALHHASGIDGGSLDVSAAVAHAVAVFGTNAGGPRQQLAFLARRLLTETADDGREIVLASPLYVADDS